MLQRIVTGSAALALTGVAVAAPEAPAPGLGGADLLSFAISLLVVVGSILAFGWLFARFRPGMNQGGEQIRVVAMRPLGPKDRLVVVEVGGQQILVGVSQGHMQNLHTLSEPLGESRPAENTVTGFASRLKAALKESAG